MDISKLIFHVFGGLLCVRVGPCDLRPFACEVAMMLVLMVFDDEDVDGLVSCSPRIRASPDVEVVVRLFRSEVVVVARGRHIEGGGGCYREPDGEEGLHAEGSPEEVEADSMSSIGDDDDVEAARFPPEGRKAYSVVL